MSPLPSWPLQKSENMKKILHGQAVAPPTEDEDRRTDAEKRFAHRQVSGCGLAAGCDSVSLSLLVSVVSVEPIRLGRSVREHA